MRGRIAESVRYFFPCCNIPNSSKFISLHFATGTMGPKARRKDWTDSSRDSLKEARERLVEVRHRSRITSV